MHTQDVIPANPTSSGNGRLPFPEETNERMSPILISVDSESAQSIYENGLIRYEKSSDLLVHPASLLKLLTAHLARQFVDDTRLDESIDITQAHERLLNPDGRLRVGDTVTFRDLFQLMALPSDNPAARVLASTVGSEIVSNTDIDPYEFFLQHMREAVQKWGWENAVIACASGLDKRSRLTAAWINNLLFRIGREDPTYLELVRAREYRLSVSGNDPRDITLSHTTVDDQQGEIPNALLVKTGTIDRDIGSLAVLSSDAKGSLIASTVLRSTPKRRRYDDMARILNID